MSSGNARLEVLHVPRCPNLTPLLDRLHEVIDAPVTTREITSDDEAAALGMVGSPTLLINGIDPFRSPDDRTCGTGCRLYRDEDGRAVPVPSVSQVRNALASSRIVLVDPAHKAVHHAIIRHFAAAGRPPSADELTAAAAGIERTTADVLAELHDLDAIRLAPDGSIIVAYPFSATSTRHRVRIADRIDVYAMCAIDALGMWAMLGEDTYIDSVDATNGQPITVITTAGRTRWEPAEAVVFIGAVACGGPSADCCCDYLNFFSDNAAAQAWSSAHPEVPGQILTQEQAEDLATCLFGSLLTS